MVIGNFITVGKLIGTLSDIVFSNTNRIYVTNTNDNTVSVINGTTGKVIGKPIPVGKDPTGIGVNRFTNTIYVANTGDNSVSVIDGAGNKVVARVMFNIKPFNSGYVVCDNATDKGKWNAPLGKEFYIYSGSGCTAKPYPGFGFISWEDNLGKNSTQLLNATTPSSALDPILDFLLINHDKPEARLFAKFGNFTANFKALPPPIPPEYAATLIV